GEQATHGTQARPPNRRLRRQPETPNPSCEAGNAFIAFGSDAGWKRDRGVHTNLVSPRGADPRQIVREDESGARSIGAMDRNDGLIGQCKTRIEITNRPSVPFGNLAEINVRKHGSGQSKLSWADAFDVHHRHHASDDNWKLHEARGVQFLRTQGRIGSSEIHSPAFYLPDADARSDGLVVDLYPGHGLVGLRPFGQNRIHKRRTSSQHGLREGWRAQARPTQRRDDDQRGEGLTHDKVSVLFDLSRLLVFGVSAQSAAAEGAGSSPVGFRANVCFTPECGQLADKSICPLCAIRDRTQRSKMHAHSSTSPARSRNDSEMVNPSVSAVLRFTINSN